MRRPRQPKQVSVAKPIEVSESQLLKYARNRALFETMSGFCKATGASIALILAGNSIPEVLKPIDSQLINPILIANMLVMGVFATYCDLTKTVNSVKFDVVWEKLK